MKNIFFAAFSLLALHGNAQFAFGVGGSGAEEGRAIARDGNNDIYVTGLFANTADFDPGSGTANLTSAGNSDIYVAKYSSTGTYQWAFKIGGSNMDGGYGITTDASNNVYVTGTFRGSNVDFDPGSGSATLSATGNQDVFVAKYSSAGAYQWAIKIGSSSADYGYAIATDASGVYVTGYFQGTADFDPGSGTANQTSGGGQDAFVAKYSSTGTYQWAFQIGDTGIDIGYGISLDGSGNVHVTGAFNGTVDFNPSGTANLTSTSAGFRDIFVGKYSSAGAYIWAFNVGSTDNDYAYALDVDGSGNVFIAGYIAQTADMDPSGATANLVSGGGADIVVAKYNSSGAYQFAFKVGSVGNDMGWGIALDGVGNILVTGYFQGGVDFDPGAGTATLAGSAGDDAFVAKYSASGAYVCALMIGASNFDAGLGIAADAANNMLVTGYFSGTTDFDPSAGTLNLTSNGGSMDFFVAKYGNPCSMISSVNEINPVVNMALYPNPSSGIFSCIVNSTENIDGSILVMDFTGKTVFENKLSLHTGENQLSMNVSFLRKGVYFLIFKTNVGLWNAQKLVIAE